MGLFHFSATISFDFLSRMSARICSRFAASLFPHNFQHFWMANSRFTLALFEYMMVNFFVKLQRKNNNQLSYQFSFEVHWESKVSVTNTLFLEKWTKIAFFKIKVKVKECKIAPCPSSVATQVLLKFEVWISRPFMPLIMLWIHNLLIFPTFLPKRRECQ